VEVNSECFLTISFQLKEDTKWAKAGHEIAWEQLKIPTQVYQLENENAKSKISAAENANEITITGNNFMYVFDKKTGEINSLQYNEKEYLEGGPVFNVWRAPLANDIDPWGSYLFEKSKMTEGLGRSIDNQLRTLGMRNLVQEVNTIEVLKKSSGEVLVKIKAFSNSSLPANRRLNWGGYFSAFQRNETWTIFADGTIELVQEVVPHGPMPDMLPKIGLQFQLPKEFNKVEWYGRGPFETYPDRKTGAKVGIYKSDADEMVVPYIIPQDYGNRTDVRWVKVQNEDGNGLMIKGGDLLNFSLHKFTTDNLSRAMYTYQLQDAPTTVLNVDYEVSGVGGTAIRQLQKYRVKAHVGQYKLTIRPF
jgi:beta-galactosidase